MKKIFSYVLLFALIFASLPLQNVSANTVNSSPWYATEITEDGLKELAEATLDYEIIDEDLEQGITKIAMTGQGLDAEVIYDSNTGNVYLDGELVSVIHIDSSGENDLSEGRPNPNNDFSIYAAPKIVNIGYRTGDWQYTGYSDTGSFSVLGKIGDAASVAAAIVAVMAVSAKGKEFPISPKNAAIGAAAAAIIQFLDLGYFTVHWDFYHHKDRNGTWWYDSAGFYYPRLVHDNMIVMVNHYYGYDI